MNHHQIKEGWYRVIYRREDMHGNYQLKMSLETFIQWDNEEVNNGNESDNREKRLKNKVIKEE